MPTFHGQFGVAYATTGPPRPGGQADVYPAQDPHGQRVAVKVARDAATGTRLETEAAELRRLTTEHAELGDVVISVLDAGRTQDDRAFIVLPWVDQDLDAWLEARSLSERLAAAAAACEVVTRLHRSSRDWRTGVVHRDIKPSNLLVVDPDAPRLVLADFGGAKRPSGRSTVGSGFHTMGYAPPDQALPRKGDPDRSWDVYALAVTVFECVVGRMPHGTRAATYAYTGEGHELLSLMDQRSRLSFSASQSRQLDDLSRRRVADLVDLDRIEPLTASDLAELGAALAKVPLAHGNLLDALRDALEPDPAQRQSDARPLSKAVQATAQQVQRAGEGATPQVARPRQVVPQTVAAKAPPAAPDAARAPGPRTVEARRPAPASPATSVSRPTPLPPAAPAPSAPAPSAPSARRLGLAAGIVAALVAVLAVAWGSQSGGDAPPEVALAAPGAPNEMSGLDALVGPDTGSPSRAGVERSAGDGYAAFHSLAEGTRKLNVRCDNGAREKGERQVRVGSVGASSCTVTAMMSTRARLTTVVDDVQQGTYRCFGDQSDGCVLE